jgi:hypothetical protein
MSFTGGQQTFDALVQTGTGKLYPTAKWQASNKLSQCTLPNPHVTLVDKTSLNTDPCSQQCHEITKFF